jgi:hypothetical protein
MRTSVRIHTFRKYTIPNNSAKTGCFIIDFAIPDFFVSVAVEQMSERWLSFAPICRYTMSGVLAV